MSIQEPVFRSKTTSKTSDRTARDRTRHKEKVRESIKKNIPDIISEESIIGQSGDKTVKIPIKGIKQYRFIYGDDDEPRVGTGTGEEESEDIQPVNNGQQGGQGQQGGDGEGQEVYETEITIDELVELIMEDLELPFLERKKFKNNIVKKVYQKKGYVKKGIRVNLDNRRTFKNKRKREIVMGEENIPYHEDDMRFKRIKEFEKPESNAVIFFLMDSSASMSQYRKYLARSFFFFINNFIRNKYNQVEIVFINHTTVAKVVSQDEFFTRVESGGTAVSSAYRKTLELIEKEYDNSIWNVFAFHGSDGDNWGDDSTECINSINELCDKSNLVGYIEVDNEVEDRKLYDFYDRNIKKDNFRKAKIKNKTDVYQALRDVLDNSCED